MKARLGLLLAGVILMAASAFGQTPAPAPPAPPAPPQRPAAAAPPAPPRPDFDPLGEALFPPELVMRHQRAIALTPEQRTYIRDQVRQAQLRFTELQWQMEDAGEALRALLEQTPVPEPQVLVQLDTVLDTEREIKRAQITLMIRIKNKLTLEQVTRLRELRHREGPGPYHLQPPAPPSPPGPPPQ